jgi:hypothetical protein
MPEQQLGGHVPAHLPQNELQKVILPLDTKGSGLKNFALPVGNFSHVLSLGFLSTGCENQWNQNAKEKSNSSAAAIMKKGHSSPTLA